MISVKEYTDDIYVVNSEYAQLWVAERGQVENADYYYGGTRTVPYNSTDKECVDRISYLKNYESGLKNVFINEVIASGILESVRNDLPDGYLGSKVGGGRCIMRPK